MRFEDLAFRKGETAVEYWQRLIKLAKSSIALKEAVLRASLTKSITEWYRDREKQSWKFLGTDDGATILEDDSDDNKV